MSDYTPGPRQTVDRCKHPKLGEGIAVYDNGPAWFRADTGEVVPMRRVSFGGWSKDDGSWLNATTASGESVRLDTTGRERGTSWGRVVGRQHGPGWLGTGGRKHPTITKWKPIFVRFEPDVGTPIEMWMEAIWCGLPKHDTIMRKLSAKAEKTIQEEREGCRWTTIKTVDGDTFVYQPEDGFVPDAQPQQSAPQAAESRQMGLPL